MEIKLEPIGFVVNNVSEKKDTDWGNDISKIKLDKKYAGGLKGLEDFSNAIIVSYLDGANYTPENLQRKPQGRDDMPRVGIFSQRGKDRPNKIGITSVEIVAVASDKLTVKGLDSINGTPILDIKPYYPCFDKKDSVKVPDWVDELMKNYF